jgi:hypothetical protein
MPAGRLSLPAMPHAAPPWPVYLKLALYLEELRRTQ